MKIFGIIYISMQLAFKSNRREFRALHHTVLINGIFIVYISDKIRDNQLLQVLRNIAINIYLIIKE